MLFLFENVKIFKAISISFLFFNGPFKEMTMSKFEISTKSAKINELQVRKIKKELLVHRKCALSKSKISAFFKDKYLYLYANQLPSWKK